ncbi:Alpha/Beta hydrolase protein [Pseudomassariella vexata]|uniref:Alpha/Beta hydrolase protein n=1 Tax=Pseudomassariella vexata TaxID=1141098 RepID=A0A1Y2DC72_9PEZI|nr:Alpha/Beta hydrolase protein [Pseudomassariella vexata]ORY56858.1 Alpha/Beta hydrolase protein [Pseudomassariella vexata]
MYSHTFYFAFAAVVSALSQKSLPTCREVEIPLTVSVPRFIVNITVQDNWDAAALTFTLTRRDSGSAADPIPIAGMTSDPVDSNFTIGATLCGTGGTTLVLTHGIIESKRYWRPNFSGAERYSLVDAAMAAGYSVLSYDRIGVGSSSIVDALWDAQFQVEVAVLDSLIAYLRSTANAAKIVLVGHSYGSYISAASASHVDIDALVLTGFSGSLSYFGPFVAGAGFRVAKIQNPRRWGHLDPGYLISSDLYAETYAYFAAPSFDHRIADWAHNFGSEPFASAELPSLLATTVEFEAIAAPVLVLQGQFDLSACGGNCVGVLNDTKALFTGAKVIETIDSLPAGHNLNLHYVAPRAFEIMFDFLKRQGK